MGMPFQFTHSGRGATYRQGSPCTRRCRFNSRTLGRVRRRRSPLLTTPHDVSIHAPWEGCDRHVRRRTALRNVSIHAPREGCDSNSLTTRLRMLSFNSRTPGGVRPECNYRFDILDKFQFTHPGRGATTQQGKDINYEAVSIHAPREGCDICNSMPSRSYIRFNSRTPGGVRPRQGTSIPADNVFQFTHPGRGATIYESARDTDIRVSIHAPRERCY